MDMEKHIASIRPLPQDLQEKSKKELNEEPNRVARDIKHIKDWIDKQPHLRARKDDQWILTFLRGCKFSLEKTKQKIDIYYTVRSMVPEFFDDRDPMNSKIQEIIKRGLVVPLVPKDNLHPTILLIRNDNYDPSEIYIGDIIKVLLMIVDILLAENDTMLVNGIIAVIDQANMGLKHLPTTTMVRKMLACTQDALPVRPKSIHCFRQAGYIEMVFSILKPFLNEKLRNRFYVHSGDSTTLFSHIPKHLLPNDYGGEAGTLKEISDVWIEKIENYRLWFKEEEMYGTDEALRPGKAKTTTDLFGIDGSFRKLDID